MPQSTHIKVTAPKGRMTPIGRADGTEPGGGLLHVTSAVVCRVRYSQDVRRAMARGDLIPCDMNGAACTITLADAPDELEGWRIQLEGDRPIAAPNPADAVTDALSRAADALVPSSKEKV